MEVAAVFSLLQNAQEAGDDLQTCAYILRILHRESAELIICSVIRDRKDE